MAGPHSGMFLHLAPQENLLVHSGTCNAPSVW